MQWRQLKVCLHRKALLLLRLLLQRVLQVLLLCPLVRATHRVPRCSSYIQGHRHRQTEYTASASSLVLQRVSSSSEHSGRTIRSCMHKLFSCCRQRTDKLLLKRLRKVMGVCDDAKESVVRLVWIPAIAAKGSLGLQKGT